MEKTAGAESTCPSFTTQVKVSVPAKLGSGVYESWGAVPSSVPCWGGAVMV